MGVYIFLLLLIYNFHSPTTGQVQIGPTSIGNCGGEINLAIAMDSSNSLTDTQFLDVRIFTRDLIKKFNRVKVFVSSFSINVMDVISETGSTDIKNVSTTIERFKRDEKGYGTRTDLAINRITEVLVKYGVPGRPSVGLIVTDGMSTSEEDQLIKAAQHALDNGIILVCVGIGNSFVTGGLLPITNYRQEHIIMSSFQDLKNTAMMKTLTKLCELSYGDRGIQLSQKCLRDGDVIFALQVRSATNEFKIGSLSKIVDKLADSVNFALGGQVRNKQEMLEYLAKDLGSFYDTSADSTAKLIREATGVLKYMRSVPKVIVLITDALHATSMSLRNAIRNALDLRVQLVVLLYGMDTAQNTAAIKSLVDANVRRRYILSHSTKTLQSLESSGYNQLLYRMCSVLNKAILPEMEDYGGPVDLSMTLDMCKKTPQGLIQPVTFLKFAENLANNLVYGPWNMSLSLGITRCHNKFTKHITTSDKFMKNVFFFHKSLAFGNMIVVGKEENTDEVGLIRYFIELLKGPFYRTAVIFVTNDVLSSGDLQKVVDDAKNHNVRILPIGISDAQANIDTNQMTQKLNILNNMNLGITMESLGNLDNAITKIAQLIPEHGQVVFGAAGINALLDATMFKQKLHQFILALMNTKQIPDATTLRQYIVNDITKELEVVRRDMTPGLPDTDSAMKYVIHYASKGTFDHAVFITNQMPRSCSKVRSSALEATNKGIIIHAIGWGNNNTEGLLCITNNDRSNMFYAPGQMRDEDFDPTINKIGNGSNVAIMVDSSVYVSEEAFIEARRFALRLIERLGMHKSGVKVALTYFGNAVSSVVDLKPAKDVSDTFVLSKRHLHWQFPCQQVISLMNSNNPPGPRTERYGFILIDKQIRYPRNTMLYYLLVAPVMTVVPIDMTTDGSIKDMSEVFGGMGLSEYRGIKRFNVTTSELKDKIDAIITDTKKKSTGFAEFGFHRLIDLNAIDAWNVIIGDIVETVYTQFSGQVDFEIHFFDWDRTFSIRYLKKDYNDVAKLKEAIIQDFLQLNGVTLNADPIAHAIEDSKKTLSSHKIKASMVVTDEVPSDANSVSQHVSNATEGGINTLVIGVGALSKENMLSYTTNESRIYIANPPERLIYEGASAVVSMISKLTEVPDLKQLCEDGKADIVIGIALNEKDNPYVLQEKMKGLTGSLELETSEIRRNIMMLYSSRYANVAALNKTVDEQRFAESMLFVAKELCDKLLTYDVTNGRQKIAILILDSITFRTSKTYDELMQLHQGMIKYIVVAIGDFTDDAIADLRLLTNYIDENLVFLKNSKELDLSTYNKLLQSICDAAHPDPRININDICKKYSDTTKAYPQLFPNPYDCNSFVKCTRLLNNNLNSDVISCQSGHRFDARTMQCRPETTVQCKVNRGFLRNTTPSSNPPGINTGSLVIDVDAMGICDRECPPIRDPSKKVYHKTSHPHACEKYILCVRSIHSMSTRIEHCSKGQFFNSNTKTCTDPAQVSCPSDRCKKLPDGTILETISCFQYHHCESGATKLFACPDDNRLMHTYTGGVKCVHENMFTMSCRSITGPQSSNQPCLPKYSNYFNDTVVQVMNSVIFEDNSASFNGAGFLYLDPMNHVMESNNFLVRLEILPRNAIPQYATLLEYCGTNLELQGQKLVLNSNLTSGSETATVPFQYPSGNNDNSFKFIELVYINGRIVLATDTDASSVAGRLYTCNHPFTLGDPAAGLNVRKVGFQGKINYVEGYTCIPKEINNRHG